MKITCYVCLSSLLQLPQVLAGDCWRLSCELSWGFMDFLVLLRVMLIRFAVHLAVFLSDYIGAYKCP
ncbi:hypothetical protein GOP47_0013254 [Adiantum capillus-veneris]|uniref:Uncharacterized protein n=1 Tax=Adiantum capillus-veneris TaxID=13818 RepID=A0A9D4ZD02_ADICA|nr:hypothetical protein GOP47_0013254 [Adiantum capillus-veneris]